VLVDYKRSPKGVIAIQTFGDFLGFGRYFHVLIRLPPAVSMAVRVVPVSKAKDLELTFQYKLLNMLLSDARITQDDYLHSRRTHGVFQQTSPVLLEK